MHAEMFILDLSVSAFFFWSFRCFVCFNEEENFSKSKFFEAFSLAMRSGLCNGRRKCNEN